MILKKIISSPLFTAELFTIDTTWKQLTCLSDEQIKIMWGVCVSLGIFFSHEKEGHPVICNMNRP